MARLKGTEVTKMTKRKVGPDGGQGKTSERVGILLQVNTIVKDFVLETLCMGCGPYRLSALHDIWIMLALVRFGPAAPI